MTFKGVSGFAIMNKRFPVTRFLQQYPEDIEKPFLPVLYGLFGKNWKGVKRFINKFEDRPHLIEVHLCFRNPHGNLDRDARKVQRRLNRIRNANTHVLISPVLEDVMTNSQWRRVAREVRPEVTEHLVRCPVGNGSGGRYLEKHGQFPNFDRPQRRCIANPDGISINFEDGESYFNQMSQTQARNYMTRYRNSHAIALWSANQQGLGDADGWGGSGAPPPKQRDFIVTDKAIQGMRQLLSE